MYVKFWDFTQDLYVFIDILDMIRLNLLFCYVLLTM